MDVKQHFNHSTSDNGFVCFSGTAEGTGSLSTGQIVGIVVCVIAAVCVAAGMQFSMYSVIACLRYVSNVNGICHVQVCNLVCIL